MSSTTTSHNTLTSEDANSTTTCRTPNILQDALIYDVQILHRLKKRNYAQQHSAQYYKRMTMALKCIDRYNLTGLPTHLLEAQTLSLHASKNNNVKNNSTSSNLDDVLKLLYKAVVEHIPECVRRIHYAASALFETMSNGYFLPFCTVAAAALARVRLLLIQIGEDVIAEYQVMVRTVPDAVVNANSTTSTDLFHAFYRDVEGSATNTMVSAETISDHKLPQCVDDSFAMTGSSSIVHALHDKDDGEEVDDKKNSPTTKQQLETINWAKSNQEKNPIHTTSDSVRPNDLADVTHDVGQCLGGNFSSVETAARSNPRAQSKRSAHDLDDKVRKRAKKKQNSSKISNRGSMMDSIFGGVDNDEKKAKKDKKKKKGSKKSSSRSSKNKDSIFDDIFDRL